MNTTVSKAKADRLYWLGRYVERVFISLNAVKKYIDYDIDGSEDAYKVYCQRVCIPDSYNGAKEFAVKYLYDKTNPYSVYSMLVRAFDNGIELRDDITSESLSYIHLALDVMENVRSPMPESAFCNRFAIICFRFGEVSMKPW